MSEREPITSAYAPDLGQLREWLEKMVTSLRFVELVVAVVALFTRMSDLNIELRKQLTGLKKRRPSSETLERLQRQLQLPFVPVEQGAEKTSSPEADAAGKPKKSRRGRHPGRAGFPAHLERVQDINPVPAALRICPRCGSQMTTVGHSMCEILEVIPARVVVIQRLDERVACPHDSAIVSAPTPPQLVERGKLGPTLIIEALADKFLEHQPIERQCLKWERAGVDLSPNTLGRSVAAAIDMLTPIACVIRVLTRGPGLLATDASGLPVLDRDAPDGIRTGTVWCWTNESWVSFVYSAIGDSDSVRRFLGEDFRRTVQCDGTSLTTFLERAGGKRPGCWSHGRRRLVEAAKGGDSLALEGLGLISRLFAIERQSILAVDSVEERLARRAEYSTPVLKELREWVDAQRANIPPKTPLGQALGYLHRQWHRLALFLEDGRLELTNNRVERELRKLVLGRRNWLFTWEDLGGERTAVILTLVGTCVAQGVNPRAYLHLVTRLLINGWPQSRLRDLLPDRMVIAHPELSTRAATAPRLLPAPAPAG